MKCTFYRTENVDTKVWEKIIKKLNDDLDELKTGKVDEAELRIYLNRLLHHAEPLEKDPRMYFYGMDKPGTMPSDARVYYYYWPTYIATGIMMKSLMLYPDILSGDRLSPEANSYSTAEATEIISACMLGCTGRGFKGGGFKELKGQLDVMKFFTDLGVMDFLKQHSELCPKFNNTYFAILNLYKTLLEEGRFFGDWDADFTDDGRELLNMVAEYDPSFLPECSPVFVYGTLMSGQSAFYKLNNSSYLGNAILSDYAMYDLGSYPGIVPQKGELVFGEVYLVDNETLRQIDIYEGEGSLYLRTSALIALNNGSKINAYIYKFNNSVSGKPVRTRWNMRDDEPVWYAGYGSNLSAERFACYIRGGICKENGKPYEGCSDTTMWKESIIKRYPGRMYFANHSSSWQGGGVSFFTQDYPQETVMRLYRITYGQFKEIQKQEGSSDKWYGRIVYLDNIDGIPVFTLTSEKIAEQTTPSEEYLSLLHNALVFEADLNEAKAEAYLNICRKKLPDRKARSIINNIKSNMVVANYGKKK